MLTLGRILVSVFAMGMNFVIIPPCFYLGVLGLNCSLSDTSVWENRIVGMQFLALCSIALVNIAALQLLRKPLTSVAYGLNGLLVLIAAYQWIVKFEQFGSMTPSLDAMIPFCIAVATVVALLWNRRSTAPSRAVQNIDER